MCLRLVAPPQGVRLGRQAWSGPSHQWLALQCLPQRVSSLRSGERHIYMAPGSRAAGSQLPFETRSCVMQSGGQAVWVLVDTAGGDCATHASIPVLLFGFTHGCWLLL